MSNEGGELIVGGVVVKAEGSGVVFSVGEGSQTLHLDAEHLPDLISFFSSLAPSPSEKRLGFRIPIAKMDPETRHNLKMEITLDGQSRSVTCLDFSLTGVLFESDTPVPDKAELDMLIDFGGKIAKMRAKVVRLLDDKKVAVHFPTTVRDGELDPPDSLISIYRNIETIWLKQRMKFD